MGNASVKKFWPVIRGGLWQEGFPNRGTTVLWVNHNYLTLCRRNIRKIARKTLVIRRYENGISVFCVGCHIRSVPIICPLMRMFRHSKGP